MAIVGNNSHLYEYEEVPKEEAQKLADENNAIFALVSSEVNYGINEINDLFISIGKKFIKNMEKKENMKINKKLIKYINY